jgi:D-arabinose 1-dehydrogenase-like Zn-dependent alcohol dehydrogenase
MSQIEIGSWVVSGHCATCGAPFISKKHPNGDFTVPITVKSCACCPSDLHIDAGGDPNKYYEKDGKIKPIYDPHNKGCS